MGWLPMTRKHRSILDALLDKAIEVIDNYDVSKLLEPKPKKLPPVKLKVLKVTSASPKAGSDARPGASSRSAEDGSEADGSDR